MKKILTIMLALTMLLLPSCGGSNAGDESTPDGMKKAGNEAVDYYFYYPEDWIIDRNDGMISIRYNTSKSNTHETYASISVTTFTLNNTDKRVDEYWNEYKEDINSTYENYKLIEESETNLDNVTSAKKIYTGGLGGASYKFSQVICIRYGYVYLVTLTASEADYDSVKEDFETTIKNFHFE